MGQPLDGVGAGVGVVIVVGVDAVAEADAPIAHVLYDVERDKQVVGVQPGENVVQGGVEGKREPVHGVCHTLLPKGVVTKKIS